MLLAVFRDPSRPIRDSCTLGVRLLHICATTETFIHSIYAPIAFASHSVPRIPIDEEPDWDKEPD